MKTRFPRLLLLALFSAAPMPALARPPVAWSEIRLGKTFFLTQTLSLGAELNVLEGQQVEFVEEMGIPYTAAILQDYVLSPCQEPERVSDAELILPEVAPENGDPTRDRRVAVQLLQGCHLEITIEGPDYESPSFFRE